MTFRPEILAIEPDLTRMPQSLHSRRARPDEAAVLTELIIRSKSRWNYDAGCLASVRHELEFNPEKCLPDFHVCVLEQNETILGFCSLIPLTEEKMELHDIFVGPAHIGEGHGKRMWKLFDRTSPHSWHPRTCPHRRSARGTLLPAARRRSSGRKIFVSFPGRKLPILEYRLAG